MTFIRNSRHTIALRADCAGNNLCQKTGFHSTLCLQQQTVLQVVRVVYCYCARELSISFLLSRKIQYLRRKRRKTIYDEGEFVAFVHPARCHGCSAGFLWR
jgi:hypothetical protein